MSFFLSAVRASALVFLPELVAAGRDSKVTFAYDAAHNTIFLAADIFFPEADATP
jgi:hypothetical protein